MSSLSVSLAAIVGVFVVVPAAVASQRLFHDVREYGAVANDDAKDTDAIRKAVDAAADAGGGTVYLSAGRYVSGAIRLKSNVTLYLDAGAILAFSQDFDDYLPMVQSRWEGTEGVNFCPPLYAYRAENIAIVGRGLIGENLQDLEVDGFRTLTPHDNCAVIDLKNASVAYVHGCSAASGTGVFLGLRGPNTRDILLQNNDLRQARSPVQTTEGCPPSAVIQD